MQLDAVPVRVQPAAPRLVEPVGGRIVDYEEDLATSITTYEELQKLVEGVAVEDGGELVGEPRIMQGDGSVDVGGLARSVRVYPRLNSDPAPGLVERTVKPEARLVLEDDGAAASGGFFLIAGNVVRNHAACRSRSARARRLRGRCTEKPS